MFPKKNNPVHETLYPILINALLFSGVFIFIAFGSRTVVAFLRKQEAWYDHVLNHQLLMEISPRTALIAAIGVMLITGVLAVVIVGGPFWFIVGAAGGFFIPQFVILHLDQKRKELLDEQLVDGIVMLASGVRAGLNLIQSIELLVKNAANPIRQEFAQLLREYQMGLDLNKAMQNAANRIGSSHYRLLFTAIEMHRLRGGDTGESLDRIAESIREIQRLEGKLDAITAQGRMQAWMMSVMPFVFLVLLYFIDPDDVKLLFTEPIGRVMLFFIAAMIATAYLWIRKIMAVDI